MINLKESDDMPTGCLKVKEVGKNTIYRDCINKIWFVYGHPLDDDWMGCSKDYKSLEAAERAIENNNIQWNNKS
ncbi:MAG: hypothetical protein GY861_25030 [bacterium]|nr:hypothetical protein [bacterium]